MAKKADSENVAREIEGPDYASAIELVRGPIRTNQSNASTMGQNNATLFKRIDKECGVHPGAAKDFAKVDKMAPEKRDDYLRSLLGLFGHAGYDKFDDLVDRMQKEAAAERDDEIEGQRRRDGEEFDQAEGRQPGGPVVH